MKIYIFIMFVWVCMVVFIGIVNVKGYVIVFMKIVGIKRGMRWFFMQIVAFKTYY